MSAIDDRCPHRFAPLSSGTLVNGAMQCGYNGLSFNGRGLCVQNPHGAITLEQQQRRMGTADLWSLKPVLLGIDAGPVKVRRILEKMIAAEHA